MSLQQVLWWLGVTLVVCWTVGLRQRLMQLRQALAPAFAHIEAQLQLRHDLIPHLIEAVAPGLRSGREPLDRLMAARNQVMAACELVVSQPGDHGPLGSLGQAEAAFATALQGFRAAVEATPELMAQESLHQLWDDLLNLDSNLTFSRQIFNEATAQYNRALREFPASLVVGAMRFHDAALLQPVALPNGS